MFVARKRELGVLEECYGHAFEEACRQWLARHIASGKVSMLCERIGSWWGTDP